MKDAQNSPQPEDPDKALRGLYEVNTGMRVCVGKSPEILDELDAGAHVGVFPQRTQRI